MHIKVKKVLIMLHIGRAFIKNAFVKQINLIFTFKVYTFLYYLISVFNNFQFFTSKANSKLKNKKSVFEMKILEIILFLKSERRNSRFLKHLA